MKLKFIIICDNAFIDQGGKLNIIQSFDNIATPGFPAIHPRLSIVTRWEFEEGDDKLIGHKQKLIIAEEKTKETIAEPPEYINNIIGLKFDREGLYKIHVYMDGEKSEDEASFEVKLDQTGNKLNA